MPRSIPIKKLNPPAIELFTGKVRLAPLTVIFGANSTGKSSIGHLLLALKQTVLSADRRQALNLGDANSLIELGTFQDCIYNHDLSKELHFQLGWCLSEPLEVIDPISDQKFAGNELVLDVLLGADENSQPKIKKLQYDLLMNQDMASGGVVGYADANPPCIFLIFR